MINPRSGAPKNTPDAQPVRGQRRQTTGELAAYHHGIAVDDTPDTLPSHEGKIPVHDSMKSPHQIASAK